MMQQDAGRSFFKRFNLDEGWVLLSVLSVINIIVIFGNILVILAVYGSAKLRNVTNIFIVSLAISDLLLGLLVLPSAVVYEMLEIWVLGDAWCRAWLATDVWISTASILNLCAISVDRYIAVTRPVKYRSIMTERRALTIVACVWLVSFLISLPPLWPQFRAGSSAIATASKSAFGGPSPIEVQLAQLPDAASLASESQLPARLIETKLVTSESVNNGNAATVPFATLEIGPSVAPLSLSSSSLRLFRRKRHLFPSKPKIGQTELAPARSPQANLRQPTSGQHPSSSSADPANRRGIWVRSSAGRIKRIGFSTIFNAESPPQLAVDPESAHNDVAIESSASSVSEGTRLGSAGSQWKINNAFSEQLNNGRPKLNISVQSGASPRTTMENTGLRQPATSGTGQEDNSTTASNKHNGDDISGANISATRHHCEPAGQLLATSKLIGGGRQQKSSSASIEMENSQADAARSSNISPTRQLDGPGLGAIMVIWSDELHSSLRALVFGPAKATTACWICKARSVIRLGKKGSFTSKASLVFVMSIPAALEPQSRLPLELYPQAVRSDPEGQSADSESSAGLQRRLRSGSLIDDLLTAIGAASHGHDLLASLTGSRMQPASGSNGFKSTSKCLADCSFKLAGVGGGSISQVPQVGSKGRKPFERLLARKLWLGSQLDPSVASISGKAPSLSGNYTASGAILYLTIPIDDEGLSLAFKQARDKSNIVSYGLQTKESGAESIQVQGGETRLGIGSLRFTNEYELPLQETNLSNLLLRQANSSVSSFVEICTYLHNTSLNAIILEAKVCDLLPPHWQIIKLTVSDVSSIRENVSPDSTLNIFRTGNSRKLGQNSKHKSDLASQRRSSFDGLGARLLDLPVGKLDSSSAYEDLGEQLKGKRKSLASSSSGSSSSRSWLGGPLRAAFGLDEVEIGNLAEQTAGDNKMKQAKDMKPKDAVSQLSKSSLDEICSLRCAQIWPSAATEQQTPTMNQLRRNGPQLQSELPAQAVALVSEDGRKPQSANILAWAVFGAGESRLRGKMLLRTTTQIKSEDSRQAACSCFKVAAGGGSGSESEPKLSFKGDDPNETLGSTASKQPLPMLGPLGIARGALDRPARLSELFEPDRTRGLVLQLESVKFESKASRSNNHNDQIGLLRLASSNSPSLSDNNGNGLSFELAQKRLQIDSNRETQPSLLQRNRRDTGPREAARLKAEAQVTTAKGENKPASEELADKLARALSSEPEAATTSFGGPGGAVSQQRQGCQLYDHKPYVIYSSLGSFYIPMFIMLFFYSRIYLVASRSQKALKRGYMITKWPAAKRAALSGFRKNNSGSSKTDGQNEGSSLFDKSPSSSERVTLRIHRRSGKLNNQQHPSVSALSNPDSPKARQNLPNFEASTGSSTNGSRPRPRRLSFAQLYQQAATATSLSKQTGNQLASLKEVSVAEAPSAELPSEICEGLIEKSENFQEKAEQQVSIQICDNSDKPDGQLPMNQLSEARAHRKHGCHHRHHHHHRGHNQREQSTTSQEGDQTQPQRHARRRHHHHHHHHHHRRRKQRNHEEPEVGGDGEPKSGRRRRMRSRERSQSAVEAFGETNEQTVDACSGRLIESAANESDASGLQLERPKSVQITVSNFDSSAGAAECALGSGVLLAVTSVDSREGRLSEGGGKQAAAIEARNLGAPRHEPERSRCIGHRLDRSQSCVPEVSPSNSRFLLKDDENDSEGSSAIPMAPSSKRDKLCAFSEQLLNQQQSLEAVEVGQDKQLASRDDQSEVNGLSSTGRQKANTSQINSQGSQGSALSLLPSQVRKQSMMLLSTLTTRGSQTLRRLSMVASHPVESLLHRTKSHDSATGGNGSTIEGGREFTGCGNGSSCRSSARSGCSGSKRPKRTLDDYLMAVAGIDSSCDELEYLDSFNCSELNSGTCNSDYDDDDDDDDDFLNEDYEHEEPNRICEDDTGFDSRKQANTPSKRWSSSSSCCPTSRTSALALNGSNTGANRVNASNLMHANLVNTIVKPQAERATLEAIKAFLIEGESGDQVSLAMGHPSCPSTTTRSSAPSGKPQQEQEHRLSTGGLVEVVKSAEVGGAISCDLKPVRAASLVVIANGNGNGNSESIVCLQESDCQGKAVPTATTISNESPTEINSRASFKRQASSNESQPQSTNNVGSSLYGFIRSNGSRRRGFKRATRWHAKRLYAETKAAKTVAIIIGGFIFCWLPFFTAYLSRAIICERPDCIPRSILSLFIWLGYLNSAINPIIYGLFSADFRQAFKKIICRCSLRRSDDSATVSILVDNIIKSIL